MALAACSATSPAEPDAEAAPTPDLSTDTNQFEQISRFGSGRAVAAAATDSLTVIASTISVERAPRRRRRGDPHRARAFPITDVAITPDATVARTAVGHRGRRTVVARTDERTCVVRFGGSGSIQRRRQWVDLVGRDSATRLSTSDGSTQSQGARPTPGPINSVTWFGTDGHTLIVRGDSTSRPGEIWNGTELVDATYEPGGLFRVVRAVGDPSADRAVFGITGGAGAVGALVSVDLTTGAERWRREVGNDAVQPVWSVGHDGRVLAVVGIRRPALRPRRRPSTRRGSSTGPTRSTPSSPTETRRATRSSESVGRSCSSTPMVRRSASRRPAAPAWSTLGRVAAGGIIAPDANGRLRQWSPAGDVVADCSDYVGGEVNDVAISADGSSAAAAASDGNVGILDLTSTAAVETIPTRFVHPEGNVDTVAFVDDGTAVVSGVSEANGESSFDDTLSRWELASDDRSFVVPGIPETISGCTSFRNTVEVSPDGEFFVATHHDFAVSMRRVDDGSLIHEFTGHTSIVWDVAISPDGRRLATSSEDWTLRLWDLDDFSLIANVDAPPGGYASVVYTPDGASILVSDSTGNVVRSRRRRRERCSGHSTARRARRHGCRCHPTVDMPLQGPTAVLIRIWELATGHDRSGPRWPRSQGHQRRVHPGRSRAGQRLGRRHHTALARLAHPTLLAPLRSLQHASPLTSLATRSTWNSVDDAAHHPGHDHRVVRSCDRLGRQARRDVQGRCLRAGSRRRLARWSPRCHRCC